MPPNDALVAEWLPTLSELDQAGEIVYQSMLPTAQHCWPLLCERFETQVWVKHENHTPIGAFKLRGGLVYFQQLRQRERHLRGVVSATRGNHGQSIGFAARKFGIPATIVVPHGNSVEKNAAMRALGVELVENGADFQDARQFAETLAAARGWHMLPSFHRDLVLGVASYSLELLRAVAHLDVIFVPIGLGSGICGLISAREALGLSTEIVGVVSEQAPAYSLSFARREKIEAPVTTVLADGMACRIPEMQALEIIWRYVSRVVSVTDQEISNAMQIYFTDTHNVAEGAGAAPLAAALKERESLRGKTIGLVLTGGNVDQRVFRSVLQDTIVDGLENQPVDIGRRKNV